MEEQANKKRGVLYYLFCCFLCPCFFPKNSNSGTSMPQEDAEGNELEEYEAVDGKENDEGDEDGGN